MTVAPIFTIHQTPPGMSRSARDIYDRFLGHALDIAYGESRMDMIARELRDGGDLVETVADHYSAAVNRLRSIAEVPRYPYLIRPSILSTARYL